MVAGRTVRRGFRVNISSAENNRICIINLNHDILRRAGRTTASSRHCVCRHLWSRKQTPPCRGHDVRDNNGYNSNDVMLLRFFDFARRVDCGRRARSGGGGFSRHGCYIILIIYHTYVYIGVRARSYDDVFVLTFARTSIQVNSSERT